MMKSRYITKHFTWDEFTASQIAVRHGINNEPGEKEKERLYELARVAELMRMLLKNNPVYPSSVYRCNEVERRLKSKPRGWVSRGQHPKGEAMDYTCPGFGDPYEVALHLSTSDLPYDQLIYEGGWTHMSTAINPRRETWTAVFAKDGPLYVPGIQRAAA